MNGWHLTSCLRRAILCIPAGFQVAVWPGQHWVSHQDVFGVVPSLHACVAVGTVPVRQQLPSECAAQNLYVPYRGLMDSTI